ncbi:Holliday junction branch migration protein RuvA [Patescibacteria group bacterium]
MINFLKGRVEDKEKDYLVINVNGIGYAVFVNVELLSEIKKGDEIKLWTYHHIRENISDLYGFLDKSEQVFFKILISVSGIGPKSALNIISKAGINNIKIAVAQQNDELLKSIGPKTAKRILVELKGKVSDTQIIGSEGHKGDESNFYECQGELLNVMVSLGYSQAEATAIIKKMPKDIDNMSAKVKWALRNA